LIKQVKQQSTCQATSILIKSNDCFPADSGLLASANAYGG